MLLNETESPLKHRVLSPGDPPNALQKSVADCQISVSFDEETGSPAKGEFLVEISLQVSHTSLQKSLLELLCRVELAEPVELQRYGIVLVLGSVSNNSAEYGSHCCKTNMARHDHISQELCFKLMEPHTDDVIQLFRI